MTSWTILITLLIFSLNINAQPKKSTYKIVKSKMEKNEPGDKGELVVKFISPAGVPAKSHITITINADTIKSGVDIAGVYTTLLSPRKYNLKFSVPYWYKVAIDSFPLKKSEQTIITVQFEAEEMKMSGVDYGR